MPEKKKMRPITKFFIGAGVGTVIGLIFLLVVLGINGQLNFSSSNSQQATNMQPENTLSKEENDSIVLREIKGEELSKKQILALGKLYDKQITELRKYNEREKQKLLEYRRKLHANV